MKYHQPKGMMMMLWEQVTLEVHVASHDGGVGMRSTIMVAAEQCSESQQQEHAITQEAKMQHILLRLMQNSSQQVIQHSSQKQQPAMHRYLLILRNKWPLILRQPSRKMAKTSRVVQKPPLHQHSSRCRIKASRLCNQHSSSHRSCSSSSPARG